MSLSNREVLTKTAFCTPSLVVSKCQVSSKQNTILILYRNESSAATLSAAELSFLHTAKLWAQKNQQRIISELEIQVSSKQNTILILYRNESTATILSAAMRSFPPRTLGREDLEPEFVENDLRIKNVKSRRSKTPS